MEVQLIPLINTINSKSEEVALVKILQGRKPIAEEKNLNKRIDRLNVNSNINDKQKE